MQMKHWQFPSLLLKHRDQKKKQRLHEKYNKDTHVRQANTCRVHVKSSRDSGLKEITKADT